MMFHMMNEARIGVGATAAALGLTGYLQSLDYAMQRPQGRPVGAKDQNSPQVCCIASFAFAFLRNHAESK